MKMITSAIPTATTRRPPSPSCRRVCRHCGRRRGVRRAGVPVCVVRRRERRGAARRGRRRRVPADVCAGSRRPYTRRTNASAESHEVGQRHGSGPWARSGVSATRSAPSVNREVTGGINRVHRSRRARRRWASRSTARSIRVGRHEGRGVGRARVAFGSSTTSMSQVCSVCSFSRSCDVHREVTVSGPNG